MSLWRLCVLLAIGLNGFVVFVFFAYPEAAVATWAATVSALFVLYFLIQFKQLWNW